MPHSRAVDFSVCSFFKCGRTYLRFILANYFNSAMGLGEDVSLRSMFSLLPNAWSRCPVRGAGAFKVSNPKMPLVTFSHAPYMPELFPEGRFIILLRSPFD